MEQDNIADKKNEPIDKVQEALKHEKVKFRYQLLSTIFGTFLVSVIGSYLLFVQNTEKNSQVFDSGHREFVSKFVDIAIDDDIERRQRLARYFASVTLDKEQKARWEEYAKYVEGLIAENPKKIAELTEKISTAKESEQAQLKARIRFLEKQLGASNNSANTQTDVSLNCIKFYDDYPGRWNCIANNELRLGVKEIPGKGSNPRILEYAEFAMSETSFSFSDDDIPWAGLFVAWVVAQSGVDKSLIPKKLLTNRSWLEFGKPTDSPRKGDIVIFWRGSRNGTKGHVGFYQSEDEEVIRVLGGNQSNAVSITRIPKKHLLGYRTMVINSQD